MDSLAGIIWVFIVFVVVISNINKAMKKADAQKKTTTHASKQTPIEEFLSSTGAEPARPAANSQPSVPARSVPSRSVPSGSLPGTGLRQGSLSGSLPIPEGVDPCHEDELRGPNLRPSIYGTTRTPYTGSLAADSGEGIDPCHEEQSDFMTVLETEDVSAEEAGAPRLAFGWTGPEIQKAVVMQEILRRR